MTVIFCFLEHKECVVLFIEKNPVIFIKRRENRKKTKKQNTVETGPCGGGEEMGEKVESTQKLGKHRGRFESFDQIVSTNTLPNTLQTLKYIC